MLAQTDQFFFGKHHWFFGGSARERDVTGGMAGDTHGRSASLRDCEPAERRPLVEVFGVTRDECRRTNLPSWLAALWRVKVHCFMSGPSSLARGVRGGRCILRLVMIFMVGSLLLVGPAALSQQNQDPDGSTETPSWRWRNCTTTSDRWSKFGKTTRSSALPGTGTFEPFALH